MSNNFGFGFNNYSNNYNYGGRGSVSIAGQRGGNSFWDNCFSVFQQPQISNPRPLYQPPSYQQPCYNQNNTQFWQNANNWQGGNNCYPQNCGPQNNQQGNGGGHGNGNGGGHNGGGGHGGGGNNQSYQAQPLLANIRAGGNFPNNERFDARYLQWLQQIGNQNNGRRA